MVAGALAIETLVFERIQPGCGNDANHRDIAGLPARDLTPSSLDGSEAHPSEPHKEEDIGLEELGDAVSNIVYDNTVLGRIDLQIGKITGSENV